MKPPINPSWSTRQAQFQASSRVIEPGTRRYPFMSSSSSEPPFIYSYRDMILRYLWSSVEDNLVKDLIVVVLIRDVFKGLRDNSGKVSVKRY